jgi:hypothetical protein
LRLDGYSAWITSLRRVEPEFQPLRWFRVKARCQAAQEEAVMATSKNVLAKIVIVVALSGPAYAMAQTSGGHSSGTAGASGTTGIASGQAHISPPGTNSLGTANSSGVTTGMAGPEPRDSQRIDNEIQRENTQVDSKINNICRGC